MLIYRKKSLKTIFIDFRFVRQSKDFYFGRIGFCRNFISYYLILVSNVFVFFCIDGNGPRTGACLEYLRPTAMPVGLAGLNKWKIALVRC